MGTTKQLLTARGLVALKPGEWVNDARPHGSGQLQARKLSTGDVAFYYRYTAPGRRQDRIPLGSGLSLAEAREVAVSLSRRYQAGDRDLRAVLDAERIAREQARVAAKADATLGDLLNAYVEALRGAGKVSADEVAGAIKRHVEKPWPTLWARPARELGMEDLLPVIARVVRAGKLREADKVRSYLRAAFAAAIRARQDPAAPETLRALGIVSNPVRDMVAVEGGSNARTRALTLAELRALWRRAVALPSPAGPILRFYLLTGGQRIEQLGRLTVAQLLDGGTMIRILDIKGRRKKPRDHFIPLIPAACDALAAMRKPWQDKDGNTLEPGPYLFTLASGIAPATYSQFRKVVVGVVDAMAEADEIEGPRFTPGDLRRTIETRLAAVGQSTDARAQLQSHGLGGVQNRHYNRHDYGEEKRVALEVLYRLLTTEGASVTPIRAAV